MTPPQPDPNQVLRLPAIEIRQGKRRIYMFGIDGKELPRIATISRVHRDDKGGIGGYQRPEVLAHVGEIRRYLESEDPLLPNSLVVAFDRRVKFEPLAGAELNGHGGFTKIGTLIIPIDDSVPDESKPGWIVDGQQRTAAIREARISSFPVSVVCFIAKNIEEQRAQFILVNETKPLPRPLIDELLPSTNGTLPKRLALRVLPNRLIERLNTDEYSPLKGLIRTQTMPDGVIAANSMIQALRNSLSDGALYQYRDPETGYGDIEQLLGLIKPFWTAVEEVFPESWGKPARRSRLMHGTGVRSLTYLMDEIVMTRPTRAKPTIRTFVEALESPSVC
jgi:DGQHR domain-containing protein